MKTIHLTDIEVEIISETLDRKNVYILTEHIFWSIVYDFMPSSRLDELNENRKKVYEEYKRNVWLDKINFQ